MTDTPKPDTSKTGDRIAKVMARAGIASRRDAERIILEGRVAVNGVKVTSPALDVLPTDRVTLDGKPIDAPQPARLWLYYKPLGLVTSAKDEKGRQTVFDTLPEGMPRVMSIGRLDLNSEGLLLLTNDGDLKRRLELPSTGWLRKYRVRVNGRPNDQMLAPLRQGVTVDGENFLPMEVTIDKQQGANAWLTIGLREGKNREIRRAMTEVGLVVNRLIRVSYGPFRLNVMKPGDIVEVKQRVMRDQLGETGGADAEDRPKRPAPARGKSDDRPTRDGAGPRKPYAGDRPRGAKPDGDRPRGPRPEGKSGPRPDRGGTGGGKPHGADRARDPKREGETTSRPPRKFDGDRPRGPKPEGDRPARPPRKYDGDRPRGPKPEGDRGPRPARSYGDSDRPTRDGARPAKPYAGDRPRGPKPEGDRPRGPKPDVARGKAGASDRPRGPKPTGGAGASKGPRSGPGGPKSRDGGRPDRTGPDRRPAGHRKGPGPKR